MSDIIEIMAREICADSGGDDTAKEYLEGAKEAVRAALRAALEAGWKLVPVEPTDDQIGAAGRACDDHGHILMKSGYRAMLASAPDPLKDGQ